MADPDLGYLGSVYLGATKIGELNHWSFNPEAGQEEFGSFGDDHRKRMYTVKDASGDFSGNSLHTDTTGQAALISQFLDGGTPASVFLYLYVSGSTGYYGPALVTPSVTADTTGLQTFACGWVAASAWLQNVG